MNIREIRVSQILEIRVYKYSVNSCNSCKIIKL